MDNNQQQQQPGNKEEIIKNVLSMFPLLTRDHYLYSTLNRCNWQIEPALDSLQKRHDTLEKEQKLIQQQVEEKKAREQAIKQEKALKEVKDIFGNAFPDSKYKEALFKCDFKVDETVDSLMTESHLINEEKEKKIKEEQRLQEEKIERERQEKLKREEAIAEIRRQEAALLEAERQRRAEELKKRLEEEELRRKIEEEEARHREEEVRRRLEEEIMRRMVEAKRRAEEEEAAAQRRAEEARLLEEETRRMEEELKRREEELKREEERRQREEEEERLRMLEEERRRQQEEEERRAQESKRVQSLLLDLKSLSDEQKKEVANSELFKEIVRDFKSHLTVREDCNNNNKIPSPYIPSPSPYSTFGFTTAQPIKYTCPYSNNNNNGNNNNPNVINPFARPPVHPSPFYIPSQPVQQQKPVEANNNTNNPFNTSPFSTSPIPVRHIGALPYPPYTGLQPLTPIIPQPVPTHPVYPGQVQQQQLKNVGVGEPTPAPVNMSPKSANKKTTIENLSSMFPSISKDTIECVWMQSENNIETAVQNLLDISVPAVKKE
ncbi:hypothetical protein SAMD00019534_097690, partial [Acytostelium subglobosum LB1]|uniref:hypothetical protein n=1 Tax=Acytostelium subglobosum LB1 TaxID=1410327 RepID=UPI000644DDDB